MNIKETLKFIKENDIEYIEEYYEKNTYSLRLYELKSKTDDSEILAKIDVVLDKEVESIIDEEIKSKISEVNIFDIFKSEIYRRNFTLALKIILERQVDGSILCNDFNKLLIEAYNAYYEISELLQKIYELSISINVVAAKNYFDSDLNEFKSKLAYLNDVAHKKIDSYKSYYDEELKKKIQSVNKR